MRWWTSRPKFPILYSKDEKFPIPGFKVLRKSDQDKVTVIGAAVTLHEALKAAELGALSLFHASHLSGCG